MDSDILRLARRVKAMEQAATDSAAHEVGAIALWPADTPPESWLLCDGSAVSRSGYAALFAVIGTAFGSGDGVTSFNLPDLKGRVAVGCKDGDAAFDVLGETGGEKTHTLTAAEMPTHTHTLYAEYGATANAGLSPTNGTYAQLAGVNAGTRYTGGSYIASEGGGGSHNNLQPYMVLHYIIRCESKERALRGDKGDKGERGGTGPAGTALRLRGEWSAAAEYENSAAYIDCVVSGGTAYYCKESHSGHAVTETAYWEVLAAKGDTGSTGATGATGAEGVSYWMNGAYDSAAAYGSNSAYIDCVTYNGSSYYAKQATTGHAPTDAAYWGLLAQKGADGAGTGDVNGPASAAAGHIAVFGDGTGKAIADGGDLSEAAQDAVGAMIADTATIDLTYTDATPQLKADLKSACVETVHLKYPTGNDNSIVTGTKGTSGYLAMWNADGDAVDAHLAASGAVKCVNRKNCATDAAVSNQLEQIGWGYVQGSGNDEVTVTVTFPVAFDDVPILFVDAADGAKSTGSGAPSSPADIPTANTNHIDASYKELSASGFTAIVFRVDASQTLGSSYYYVFTWRAIGTKSR